MRSIPTSFLLCAGAAALLVVGCSGSDSGSGPGTGGNLGTGGSGGSAPSSSGSGGTTSTGGSMSTGGSPGTGGAQSTISSGGTGAAVGTGGSSTSSGAGGTIRASGGTTSSGLGGMTGTGGISGKGGTVGTGGAVTTGGTVATGGAEGTGGATSTTSSGGASATGGTTGTGGTAGSSGTVASCPDADPTEFGIVSDWLNNQTAVSALPTYAYSNIKKFHPAGAAFDKLACSIAMSCKEFAPAETDWLRKCEAVVASAIVAESSYDPSSVVTDSYGTRTVSGVTANDPTVGLLQIRFSSTVHDYNYNGPPTKMAAIGCSWPSELLSQTDTDTYWATAGGTTYLAFMKDVACNIGLATWYYFYNATGNGGASAVWISQYCAGKGIAGTMVVGLLSHLMGGGFTRPADPNNAYPWGIECCACGSPADCTCTGCSGRFAAFMNIGTTASRPSPDPFQESLSPEPTKYCK